jgi:hypothetical protein
MCFEEVQETMADYYNELNDTYKLQMVWLLAIQVNAKLI